MVLPKFKEVDFFLQGTQSIAFSKNNIWDHSWRLIYDIVSVNGKRNEMANYLSMIFFIINSIQKNLLINSMYFFRIVLAEVQKKKRKFVKMIKKYHLDYFLLQELKMFFTIVYVRNVWWNALIT